MHSMMANHMFFVFLYLLGATAGNPEFEGHGYLNTLLAEDHIAVGGMRFKIPQKTKNRLIIPDESVLNRGLLGYLLEYVDKEGLSLLEMLASTSYSVSQNCINDTEQLLRSLSRGEDYATSMFDADAKIPSGVKEGNLLWMGSYEECVAATSPILESGLHISGQYCAASFNFSLGKLIPYPIALGLCVPNRCSRVDVQNLLHSALANNSVVKLTSTACEVEDKWTVGAIVALVVCGLVVLLVAVGTLADALYVHFDKQIKLTSHLQKNGQNSYGGPINERTGLLSNTSAEDYNEQLIDPPKRYDQGRFLVAFSILTNTRKLLSTSTASSPLASLNGLRVLSMWWVILGHSFVFLVSAPGTVDNILKAYDIIKDFWFQPILNGTFSVDSFFFMSGLLVTFLCLKNLREKEGKLNWGMFYFHRFWRLTPAYGFLLMVWGSLFTYMLSPGPKKAFLTGGPDPGKTLAFLDYCRTTVWSNLLYLNNFYPHWGNITQQCMGWSWYLANDMQFFVISPLIIILFYKNKRIALAVCGVLIVVCVLTRALTAYELGMYLPANQPTKHQDNAYVKGAPLYNKPYTRIAPYIVGMIVGYVLYQNQCRTRLPKVVVWLGWAAAIAIGMSTVYGQYYYFHNTKSMSLGASAFYTGVNRLSWSIALAWVIFACATGYGGIINTILSWNVWAPLGRLTYCAYLVHPIVMEVFINSMTGTFHFTILNIVYFYLANLVASYLFAYLVSMAVEAPMMGLEKILFKRGT